jgi:hypothetical protein
MENNDIKPVFVGTTVSNDHATLTPEVITLEGEVRLRMTLANGEDIILPLETLSLLGQNANRMQSELNKSLEEARFLKHYPVTRYEEGKFSETKGGNGGRRISSYVSRRLYLVGTDIYSDGTPFIAWSTNESGVHGWKLSLIGIDDAPIGWAAWDDPKGVDELITMLSDQESCVAIAGIVAPSQTSEMSARVAAKALRSGRKLPGINIAKVRKVFEDGGIANSGATEYANPQVKVLAIASGDKRVPVAVAVSAPSKFANQPELTEEQLQGLNWQQRRQAEDDLVKPLVEAWGKKVDKAFVDAGWRVIDLPKPKYYYGYSQGGGTRWYTLINPEIWANVSAAATQAATDFYFSRATRI